MIRPKRRAAPTKFIDNGTIPEDNSEDERTLSNEDELLKETYSDVSQEDSTSLESEEEPKPLKKQVKSKINNTTASESTVPKSVRKVKEIKVKEIKKAELKKTTKELVKEPVKGKIKKEKIVKNPKNLRTFRLLTELVISQDGTPGIPMTKLNKIKKEYSSTTPIQCAKHIAPILYEIGYNSRRSTFMYIFTIQEIKPEIKGDENGKKFCYISESTRSKEKEVTHIVKPQLKAKIKADKNMKNIETVISDVITNYPIIKKKTIPSRTGVQKLLESNTKK